MLPAHSAGIPEIIFLYFAEKKKETVENIPVVVAVLLLDM